MGTASAIGMSVWLRNNVPVGLDAPYRRIRLDFVLSKNEVLGDADDVAWGTYETYAVLGAGEEKRLEVTERGLDEMRVPVEGRGRRHVFARVRPETGVLDNNPANDVSMADPAGGGTGRVVWVEGNIGNDYDGNGNGTGR